MRKVKKKTSSFTITSDVPDEKRQKLHTSRPAGKMLNEGAQSQKSEKVSKLPKDFQSSKSRKMI